MLVKALGGSVCLALDEEESPGVFLHVDVSDQSEECLWFACSTSYLQRVVPCRTRTGLGLDLVSALLHIVVLNSSMVSRLAPPS